MEEEYTMLVWLLAAGYPWAQVRAATRVSLIFEHFSSLLGRLGCAIGKADVAQKPLCLYLGVLSPVAIRMAVSFTIEVRILPRRLPYP